MKENCQAYIDTVLYDYDPQNKRPVWTVQNLQGQYFRNIQTKQEAYIGSLNDLKTTYQSGDLKIQYQQNPNFSKFMDRIFINNNTNVSDVTNYVDDRKDYIQHQGHGYAQQNLKQEAKMRCGGAQGAYTQQCGETMKTRFCGTQVVIN